MSTEPRAAQSLTYPIVSRRAGTVLLAGLLALLAAPAVSWGQPAEPRLYVIVSVDQMREDYIARYGHMWTRGLRRLVDGGARFTQSRYPYMNTVTCPGHATIGTGTFPSTHGMVLNQWWDRQNQKVVACTDDGMVAPVHVNGSAPLVATSNSGRSLLAPTFADELRAQSGARPRIASMSLKARSAIAMAGRTGDLVLWFDADGGWTTSSAFTTKVPQWLADHVKANPPDADFGKEWTPLLADKYLWVDAGLGEGRPNGWTTSFPHDLTTKSGTADREFRGKWEDTPFADAALTGLAKKAMDELQLGREPGRRDVLAVSYSVLDHIGHAFGPRSHEVQDVLARLDVTLGDLIEHLDRSVGADHYVLAFTGDHGVSPIPEQMIALGMDAGRVATADVRQRIDKALEPFFGAGPHLAAIAYTDLYFVPGRFDAVRANPQAMAAVAAAIESVPGVARVYRSDQLFAATDDPIARAVAAGYHPARSGDLLLVPRAYWITSGAIATHGTTYDYDSRVPLLLFGAGIQPGTYTTASSPADIATTFAHLAGVTLPKPDGRVLLEALKAPAAGRPAAQTATP